ncbi:MAG TPA: endonuclease VIII [Thermotogota bacterium]|nr:endonuclease VIII [Thermotogota bacterium]
MVEIPEARTISKQMNRELTGKKIVEVIAAQNPHKFAWYYEDPGDYPEKLMNRTIDGTESINGIVEVSLGDYRLVFNEGIRFKYGKEEKDLPKKHQLLLRFDDLSYLVAFIQMYGGIYCFKDGTFTNPYYLVHKEKPNPLGPEFDFDYFKSLIGKLDSEKISIKAFLATEQRIPGLGNGVLQDILWQAKVHPKRKLSSLSGEERKTLFEAIKETLKEMARLGGRDTETDLYGNKGGYQTTMSKNNKEKKCPLCQGDVIKKAYMGGSIYYCETCQPE